MVSFVHLGLMFLLWGEHNNRTFEGVEEPAHRLKSLIFFPTLHSWARGSIRSNCRCCGFDAKVPIF